MAAVFGEACHDGAPALTCLAPFGGPQTRPSALNTTTPSTHSSYPGRAWKLWSLAPVLPGGWVLVGEQSKYVHVSPQRFNSVFTNTTATASTASDAYRPSEIVGTVGGAGGGSCLKFDILGAVGEIVLVSVVVPGGSGVGSPGGVLTDLGRAQRGTVSVVKVTLAATQACQSQTINQKGAGFEMCFAPSTFWCWWQNTSRIQFIVQ